MPKRQPREKIVKVIKDPWQEIERALESNRKRQMMRKVNLKAGKGRGARKRR